MKIPKLANGGVINNKLPLIGKDKGKSLFKDKYYEIYKRTKNRRIKKKQLKKSWILKSHMIIEECIMPIDKLHIFIGGKEIKQDENNN